MIWFKIRPGQSWIEGAGSHTHEVQIFSLYPFPTPCEMFWLAHPSVQKKASHILIRRSPEFNSGACGEVHSALQNLTKVL